jgi:hypothetical protein
MGMMAYVLDLLYWSVIIENNGVNAKIKQHLDSFAT